MAELLISAAVNLVAGFVLNLLFPPPDIVQEGPRLEDLSVSSSAYGQTIPILYGTIRTGGNVIWSPGIEEVVETEKVGGKGIGGPSVKVVTYTYFASFAIAFGEGAAQDVLRIWADSKLIFSKTAGAELSVEDLDLSFVFYPGDEEQMPDPLIEADVGVGQAPAHRGMCYIVFNRLPLADFVNRIPNISAEIAFVTDTSMPFTELELLPGANIPGSPAGSDSLSHMFVAPFSDELFMMKGGETGMSRSSIVTMAMEVQSEWSIEEAGPLFPYTASFGMDGYIYSQFGNNYSAIRRIDPTSFEVISQFGTDGTLGGAVANGAYLGLIRKGFPEYGIPYQDFLIVSDAGLLGDGGVDVYQDFGALTGFVLAGSSAAETDLARAGPVIHDYHGARIFAIQQDDDKIEVTEIVVEFTVGIDGAPTLSLPTFELRATILKGGVDLAGTGDMEGWCVLPEESAIIISNGVSMCKIDMDGVDGVVTSNLSLGFYSMNQWSNTGRFAFGNGHTGDAPGGTIITIRTSDLSIIEEQTLALADFPDNIEANYKRGAYDPRNNSYIFSRVNNTDPTENRVVRVLLQRAEGLQVPLSSIVADQAERGGLTQEQYDVSDLTGEMVDGYACTRQASVRDNLQPLQQAFLFEGVESDYVMKFVRRGGEPIMELDPLDVGFLSTGDEEPLKEVRTQEVELPERVSVRYSERENDYQQGLQQTKRTALPTPTMYARSEVTVDLPLVSTATTMKRLAERILYTGWAERVSYEFGLPWKYLRLDPTDLIVLPQGDEDLLLRLGDMEIGAGFAVNLKATKQDAQTDLSNLVADKGQGFIPQILPSRLPSRIHLLDLPILAPSDDGAQLFSRAYFGTSGWDDTWPGAVLYSSRDNGTSYTSLGGGGLEMAWGTVVGTLPDPGTVDTWDESATIQLRVRRGIDQFDTATDEEVLNGANAIAVRGPNGPEIIQFVNATQVDDHIIELSRLLRGRLGTEFNAVDHASSETFVLLNRAHMATFQLPLNLIGVSLPYKGPTVGTLIEDTPTTFFAYRGEDLKPYPPAHIEGERDPGTQDLTVTWERRTRFLGEMRDGTGEVPLNESIEEYDVEWYYNDTLVKTQTVTSKEATLTVAEWEAAGFVVGQVPILNGSFEIASSDVSLAGWESAIAPYTFLDACVTSAPVGAGSSGSPMAPRTGSRLLWMGSGLGADATEYRQTIDLYGIGYEEDVLNAELPNVTVTYWHAGLHSSQTEPTEVIVEFRDNASALISSMTSGDVVPPDFTWTEGSVSGALPFGTRYIRIRLRSTKVGGGILPEPDTCFDDVSLSLGPAIPPVRVKVFQKSAIVGRGRPAEAIV